MKSKHGGKFVVKISEPAKVSILVNRTTTKKGKRKVVGRSKTKDFSQTAVIIVRGELARKFSAGGHFRATAIAVNQAGNRSKPKRLKLRF